MTFTRRVLLRLLGACRGYGSIAKRPI